MIKYHEKQYNGKRIYSAHNLGYNSSKLESHVLAVSLAAAHESTIFSYHLWPHGPTVS